jgi:hypothetical protein
MLSSGVAAPDKMFSPEEQAETGRKEKVKNDAEQEERDRSRRSESREADESLQVEIPHVK